MAQSVLKTIQEELQLTHLEPLKSIGGGCISESVAYKCDLGLIFVKFNSKENSKELFEGEFASLEALAESGQIRVPHPIKIITCGETTIPVSEYLKFSGLHKYQSELGHNLAKLHLHNLELLKVNDSRAVKKFGFHTTTCCGQLAIDNRWNEDWVEFYCKQRLQPQIEMAIRKSGNKEAENIWSQLKLKIGQLFGQITVLPSLLHGDLWSGNAGETESEPVIFDPACFYGHHEFDLAIARMFGGFNKDFFKAYHKVIPREPGFEQREPLYELFHYLNHWNHFGGGYKQQSLSIMRNLLRTL